MRFTVQKLQHDLVSYLESADPVPYSVRIENDGKVFAAYTASTPGGVSYVRLIASFLETGIQVDLEHWMVGAPEAALLTEVTLIKAHLIRSMAPHTVERSPTLTHPLSRFLGSAARWVESWISSAFRPA